jgi:hypothetical protein
VFPNLVQANEGTDLLVYVPLVVSISAHKRLKGDKLCCYFVTASERFE